MAKPPRPSFKDAAAFVHGAGAPTIVPPNPEASTTAPHADLGAPAKAPTPVPEVEKKMLLRLPADLASDIDLVFRSHPEFRSRHAVVIAAIYEFTRNALKN